MKIRFFNRSPFSNRTPLLIVIKRGILIWLSLLLIPLSACDAGYNTSFGGAGYNASVCEMENDSFNDDFLNNNKVRGALYDGILSTDNESLPSQRTFIIDNETDYNSIFKPSAPSVNFDSETIIVYTYTAINLRKVKMSKVTISDKSIKIELKEEKVRVGVGDSRVPYQRFLVINLSKVDISNAEISLI